MVEVGGDERITRALPAFARRLKSWASCWPMTKRASPFPAQVQQLGRHASLYEQCRKRGWTLAVDQLWYLANWTAPFDLPKRFNVPFCSAYA